MQKDVFCLYRIDIAPKAWKGLFKDLPEEEKKQW